MIGKNKKQAGPTEERAEAAYYRDNPDEAAANKALEAALKASEKVGPTVVKAKAFKKSRDAAKKALKSGK